MKNSRYEYELIVEDGKYRFTSSTKEDIESQLKFILKHEPDVKYEIVKNNLGKIIT